jgi:pyruvate kinase
MDTHVTLGTLPRPLRRQSRLALADARVALARLAAAVAGLRQDLQREGRSRLVEWRPLIHRSAFLPGAANLAHYLALRRRDLGPLQEALSRHGLSSLGRCEARVAATLDAVHATLARAAGAKPPSYPSTLRMNRGARILDQQTKQILGRDPGGPRSRVMVTLPAEIAQDLELARALVAAGADCARINCAHGGPEEWRAMAGRMREAAAALGRDMRILMDLGGPKLRLSEVSPEKAPRLRQGDGFRLMVELGCGREGISAVLSHPELLPRLHPGAELWVDDGRLGAHVEAVCEGGVELRVFAARAKGVRLRPGKGVNLPGMELHLPPLTPKDLADLDTAAELADMVGFSFVQHPQDVAWLQRELAARRPGLPPLPIVLKIETPLALRNLPELIVQCAGTSPTAVMLARGDLAVELGFERLAEAQEQVLWLCEAAHVPVIWATQVLEGLVKHGLPSRAETTDAAMAQRADCVMLNKGPHLPEGVAALERMLRRMDRHQAKKTAQLPILHAWAAASS